MSENFTSVADMSGEFTYEQGFEDGFMEGFEIGLKEAIEKKEKEEFARYEEKAHEIAGGNPGMTANELIKMLFSSDT